MEQGIKSTGNKPLTLEEFKEICQSHHCVNCPLRTRVDDICLYFHDKIEKEVFGEGQNNGTN